MSIPVVRQRFHADWFPNKTSCERLHACKRKKVLISNAREKFILKVRLNDFITEYMNTQYKFKFTIHM